MICVVGLLIVMLLLPDDSCVGRIVSWVPCILLPIVLFRSIYIGWRLCQGKRCRQEKSQVIQRRDRILNFMYGLFFCIMLALALWKLVVRL